MEPGRGEVSRMKDSNRYNQTHFHWHLVEGRRRSSETCFPLRIMTEFLRVWRVDYYLSLDLMHSANIDSTLVSLQLPEHLLGKSYVNRLVQDQSRLRLPMLLSMHEKRRRAG